MEPLKGLKVVDLTRLLPGAFCTLLLADMGADVIKVEEPTRGDYMRELPPKIDGESALFLAVNRNKKSITLNLKAERGREAFLRLAKTADVVVEGFRPGVAKRLGVDYESVRKVNESVIYCSITGYGQSGPYRGMPGHDINYAALAGALSLTGMRGGPPVILGVQVADLSGALFAALSILAALHHREKTGEGQYIDVSMTDCVISLLSMLIGAYFAEGKPPKRGETLLLGGLPCYNVYETGDGGYIAVGAPEERFWRKLCRALNLPREFEEWQYADGDARERIFSALREKFLTKGRDEWVEILCRADVPCAPVYTLDEVFVDPHIKARGLLVEVPHPRVGRVKQVRFPVNFSLTPTSIRSPPPLLGQHTEEILSSLGYTKEEIEEMRRNGVI